MEKVTILLNEGPASMKTWNGIRIAAGLVGVDVEVEIFLLDAAIYAAKKDQRPPEGLKELNIGKKLAGLMDLGIIINACGTCVDAAGFAQDDMIEGVIINNLVNLCKTIKVSANVMVF